MVYDGCNAGFINDVQECLWRYESVDEKTGDITHTKSFRMCANVGFKEDPHPDVLEFAVDDKNSVVYFTVNAKSSGYDLKYLCSAAISIK